MTDKSKPIFPMHILSQFCIILSFWNNKWARSFSMDSVFCIAWAKPTYLSSLFANCFEDLSWNNYKNCGPKDLIKAPIRKTGSEAHCRRCLLRHSAAILSWTYHFQPEILSQFGRPYCLSGERTAGTRKGFVCSLNLSHLRIHWKCMGMIRAWKKWGNS